MTQATDEACQRKHGEALVVLRVPVVLRYGAASPRAIIFMPIVLVVSTFVPTCLAQAS